MRKVMMLAAMLAMVLVAAAPALAQDNAVAGDVQIQDSVCAQVVDAAGGQANLGSSGASSGDIGSASAASIAQELGVSVEAVQNCLQAGGDINVSGGAAAEESAAAVQYQYAEEGGAAGAAAAAAGVLPETGGASLIALGAGALLVAGGLLARRIVR